jgi:hypothetical protein
LLAGA